MINLGSIVLRKFEVDDVECLYTFRNDREISSGLVGFSVGYSHEDLTQWINHHRNLEDEMLWAIADAKGGQCIGHVGLYQIDHRIRKAEFGIIIGDRAWQGKGVGRLVSRTTIEFGFSQLNLNKISLTVLASNKRARRLYASLGFVEEGTLRADEYRDGEYIDIVVMSVLVSEWES